MVQKTIITLSIAIMLRTLTFAQEGKEENTFKAYWDNNIKIESADKRFKMAFGGRIQYDLAFFFQDTAIKDSMGELRNGTEFRRVRLYNKGQLFNFLKYKVQLDFAGGNVVFKDVYIAFTKIPGIGTLTVGQFKEPLRLEVLTSSNYITFMERSFLADLNNERNNGIMISNEALKSRLGWQLGIFRNADAAGNDVQAGNRINLTGRITGLPCRNENKKHLLHLGLGYSYRIFDGKDFELELRPGSHLSPEYVNLTVRGIQNIHVLAPEAALVTGPFSIQTEFLQGFVQTNSDSIGDYNMNSFYGQVSYFITGESRNYKSSVSGFNRIKPKKNFGKEGTGAWEIAARYSRLDLNSNNVKGGEMQAVAAGINWYLNPVSRIMLNYTFTKLKGMGNTHILGTRFQVDF